MLKWMLLAWMIAVAPLTAFAQSTDSTQNHDPEVQAILVECDAILAEMAELRDTAIRNTDVVETERDEARGALKQIWPELEATRNENELLRLQVASQPSRVVWAGIGAGAALVAGGVLVYLVGTY